MLLSFYHSVCVEDFCKSNQPISLKLDVRIGRVFDRSEELTNSRIPDTDSGSFFHCCYHCEAGDFRRFISISRSVAT